MKVKKKVILFSIVILLTFIFSFSFVKPIYDIYNLPEIVAVTYDGINEINKEKHFGKFITFDYDNSVETFAGQSNEVIKVKLLNCITLRTLKIGLNSIEVYAGGDTIGFSLNSKGVVLIGKSEIVTINGKVEIGRAHV